MKRYIDNVCYDMNVYLQMRVDKAQSKKVFMALCEGFADVMLEWTGCTWVGQKKDVETEEMYQQFWMSLCYFIDVLSMSKIPLSKVEKNFLDSVTYRGEIYRYLGYPSPNKRKAIEPKFNGIYVSWSKNKENSYLESKLYGKITFVSGIIEAPNYGIDLEGFNVFYNANSRKKRYISKGKEREVVFPTKEECISSIIIR